VTALPPVRAVLFDVDGTLYHQEPLRALMAAELAALPARRTPAAARRELRALAAFRRVREELRAGRFDRPLERLQFERAAARAGLAAEEMERIVAEWIFARPLKYLRLCRRRGAVALLEHLAERGVRSGVFSDYPVAAKLEALGLAGWMSAGLCATDPEIDAFKPDPRGFLRACQVWGLAAREVLYVGDRPRVDAEGAARAGMPCAIVGRGRKLRGRRGCLPGFSAFPSFAELRNAIDRCG